MVHSVRHLVMWGMFISVLVAAGCKAGGPQSSDNAPPPAAPPPPGSGRTATSSNATSPAPAAEAVTVTVFAGAASKPALEILGQSYERKTGKKVDITFGGSGSVLTQFSQEQYGDLYIPGSDDFMDRAEKQGAVLADTRTILVYLVPMICVPKGNPHKIKSLEDLAKPGLRVVIGDIKAVCLGDIAHAVLKQTKLWDKVEKRIVSYANSCEDVLNTLLLGESDAVIGWDAWPRQHPDKVEGIAIPKELARPRNIPAAVIKWSKQPEEAKAFIEFLTSQEAKAVFEEKGYSTSP